MKTRIKICGLRRPEDITAANALRPDYVGFVFAPSKRQVTPEQAASLRKGLAPDIPVVGVFVHPDENEVAALCEAGVVDVIQLHGDEDDTFIAKMKRKTGVPVIKSVSVGAVMPQLPSEADFLLFDTAGAARGGMGKAFDWNLLSGYRGIPYFLAGGLDAGNVRQALKMCAPYAVDVSSGVETDGLKDARKMADFVGCIRALIQERSKGVYDE